MKKSLIALGLSMVFLLSSCGSATGSAITVAPVLEPTITPTPTFAVNTAVVDGGGLIETILDDCSERAGTECFWTDFAGLAAVCFKDGEPYAFIQDLVAFNSLAVVGDLGFTTDGDTIVWGSEEEVFDYVRNDNLFSPDLIVISSEIMVNDDGVVTESVTFFGGMFVNTLRITHQRDPYQDYWRGYVSIQEFDLNVAIARSMGDA